MGGGGLPALGKLALETAAVSQRLPPKMCPSPTHTPKHCFIVGSSPPPPQILEFGGGSGFRSSALPAGDFLEGADYSRTSFGQPKNSFPHMAANTDIAPCGSTLSRPLRSRL